MNCNDCSGLLPHGCVCNQRYAATAPSEQDQPADQSQAKQAEYPPTDKALFALHEAVERIVGHPIHDSLRPALEAAIAADRAARVRFVLPLDDRAAMHKWALSTGFWRDPITLDSLISILRIALAARPRGAGD